MSTLQNLGASLLITGTCIGAGMLGLPVETAPAGIIPAITMFVVVWGVMTLSALLMLEVTLAAPDDSNIISMAKLTLGTKGRAVAWFVYLMLFYALLASYTSGGSSLVHRALNDMGLAISTHLAALIFVLPFVIIIACGARAVDLINRCLILGLVITYTMLLSCVTGRIDLHLSQHSDWHYVIFALPIMVTAFGFHHLIPSLKTYLHGRVASLRMVIIIGGLLPLLVYVMWEVIVLYLVPVFGTNGLIGMLNSHSNPAELLVDAISHGNKSVFLIVAFLSFFVITTSFVGVALGLFDFLADGLKITKNRPGRVKLACIAFVPPFIYSWVYPEGFLLALDYAGIFAAILLIIYPALMAWKIRYKLQLATKYQVVGGKALIVAVLGFGIFVVIIEILYKTNFLQGPDLL